MYYGVFSSVFGMHNAVRKGVFVLYIPCVHKLNEIVVPSHQILPTQTTRIVE